MDSKHNTTPPPLRPRQPARQYVIDHVDDHDERDRDRDEIDDIKRRVRAVCMEAKVFATRDLDRG